MTTDKKPTTPAAELRKAAEKIRALTWDASDGPWAHEHEGGYIVHGQQSSVAEAIDRAADAAHIATWHPLVALAVAAWLKHWAELDPSERETRCGMCGDDHALTIARLINGDPS